MCDVNSSLAEILTSCGLFNVLLVTDDIIVMLLPYFVARSICWCQAHSSWGLHQTCYHWWL